MNKFALLGLLGIFGSTAAFSPVATGRAQTNLASEAVLATSPPLTNGGEAAASLADIHPMYNMETTGPADAADVAPDLQGHLGPVGLTEIRAQQNEVGLHAYSSKFDYSRGTMRH